MSFSSGARGYALPGYEGMDPDQAAELLHRKKNTVVAPDTDYLILTGAIKPAALLTPDERAYPCAMYRDWSDDGRAKARARAAGRLQMNLANLLDLEAIDAHIGAFDSCLALNETGKAILEGQGWRDSQDKAKALAFTQHRTLATDAALSMHDDRRLSPPARAQRDAVEDAAPDHVAEIPRTPIPAHAKKSTGS
jgi:hypothetical protein